MSRPRPALLDGTALIYRAFFAIPANFATTGGLPTNATYGFASSFRKLLAGRLPKAVGVIFDPPGPTFRDKVYPAYKAQRPRMPSELKQQLPWIEKVVEAHGFRSLRVPGFEADDVIGTLTKKALEEGYEVWIVSGDKDFAQLVGEHVRMLDTMRDITYDAELVKKKWGVPPELFVDYLALVGDKVDNIPGVPGIGQKGGAKLLLDHGGLEGLLKAKDSLKGRAKTALIEHEALAKLGKELATIRCDVELPFGLDDLAIEAPDPKRLDALYRELEFFSLLSGEDAAPKVEASEGDYAAIESLEALSALLASLGAEPVAVHPLYDLPTAMSGALAGIAFATSAQRVRYVPLLGQGGLGSEALELLRPYLSDPAKPKVVHDLRDAQTALRRRGLDLRGVILDTQLASFLIDPTKIIPHRLDQIVREFLHRTLAPAKTVTGSGQKERAFSEVPVAELTPWVAHQAAAVWELRRPLTNKLEEEGHRRLHDELSVPMAYVLAEMQLEGIRVDRKELDAMGVEFEARKAEVEAAIYKLAKKEFNIGSTKQLAEVLFEDLGLPVIKRTKTGYSTDAEVLERLAAKHEIAKLIVRQRALAKLINTYTRVLVEAMHPETGRIHCTFQQTVGASGRLITTEPDLQRTPIRTEDGKRIRQAFIPREGWQLISADWSQIELRILAHVSEDPLLIEAFEKDLDVHARTASQIFDVPPEKVTREQRNVGKTVNFATIYGQGATALGQSLDIPKSEAKDYIDRYFERYAKVRSWLDRTIADAHVKGYVETLAGRRRYIPELSSRNFTDRAYGERVAANTPIQGSAADLCKIAMLGIDKALREAGLQTKMLLQIHDELVFTAPPEEVERAEKIVAHEMEHAVPMKVPLKVDIGHGASWAEAH